MTSAASGTRFPEAIRAGLGRAFRTEREAEENGELLEAGFPTPIPETQILDGMKMDEAPKKQPIPWDSDF